MLYHLTLSAYMILIIKARINKKKNDGKKHGNIINIYILSLWSQLNIS